MVWGEQGFPKYDIFLGSLKKITFVEFSILKLAKVVQQVQY